MNFFRIETCLLALCLLAPAALVRAQQKPNMVVIIADQWKGQALGFLKKEPVLTPHLDALSQKGFVMKQMVSNYPLCSPARAMFLTGKYPLKNKVYSNVNSASAPYGIELARDIVCLSDVLKENGYSNGYIGKWHLDAPHEPYVPTSNNTGKIAWNEWTPPERRHGFDHWYAYGTYDAHDRPMYWDTWAMRDGYAYVDEWGPVHEAKKALAFFRNDGGAHRDPGKPFFLVVSMNPPHSEYETVPAKYHDMYKDIPIDAFTGDPNVPAAGTPMGDHYRKQIRNYYANMTGVDEQVGEIMRGLKEMDLEDNTIVVFMADHGNCLGKHNEVSKNNIYEESLNIPFILYWKGHVMPRIDDRFLGSMPDLFPTFLEMMGLGKSIPSDLDGVSYAAYFTDGKGKKPTSQYIMGGIASNDVKINSGFRGIRTKDHKLAYVKSKGRTEAFLFDLKNDPFELKNLYDPKSPLVKKTRRQLIRKLAETKDSFGIPSE